jgi:hypothetical protein
MKLTTELKQEIFELLQGEFEELFCDTGYSDGDANLLFPYKNYEVDIKGYFSNGSYDLIHVMITDTRIQDYDDCLFIDYTNEDHSSYFQSIEEELTICMSHVELIYS